MQTMINQIQIRVDPSNFVLWGKFNHHTCMIIEINYGRYIPLELFNLLTEKYCQHVSINQILVDLSNFRQVGWFEQFNFTAV